MAAEWKEEVVDPLLLLLPAMTRTHLETLTTSLRLTCVMTMEIPGMKVLTCGFSVNAFC